MEPAFFLIYIKEMKIEKLFSNFLIFTGYMYE